MADKVRVLGPDHPDTLTVRGNIAAFYGEAGSLEQAIGLLEALFAAQVRVLGPDHPLTLTVRGNLASIHRWAMLVILVPRS